MRLTLKSAYQFITLQLLGNRHILSYNIRNRNTLPKLKGAATSTAAYSFLYILFSKQNRNGHNFDPNTWTTTTFKLDRLKGLCLQIWVRAIYPKEALNRNKNINFIVVRQADTNIAAHVYFFSILAFMGSVHF